jgi:hypothetical protein
LHLRETYGDRPIIRVSPDYKYVFFRRQATS